MIAYETHNNLNHSPHKDSCRRVLLECMIHGILRRNGRLDSRSNLFRLGDESIPRLRLRRCREECRVYILIVVCDKVWRRSGMGEDCLVVGDGRSDLLRK